MRFYPKKKSVDGSDYNGYGNGNNKSDYKTKQCVYMIHDPLNLFSPKETNEHHNVSRAVIF